jgi:hypothetical protein
MTPPSYANEGWLLRKYDRRLAGKATGNGTGESAKAFPVVRSYMAGHLPMVTVRLDDGREWDVIASWRGRFI